MLFNYANMKSIKADITKKEITVSFVVDMSQDNLSVSEDLSRYVDAEAGTVVIDIQPRQPALV